MKIRLPYLLFLFITLGCAQNKDNIKFDEAKLLERMEILSSDAFEGRKTGEKGNDSARAYIIKELKSIGVSGFQGKYEHPFTFKYRNKTYNGTNVLAEIKGTLYPEKYIVISAHHDHLGTQNGVIYNGADDDASGISALITYAEYLVENPPKHSVIIAAFDAEELGINGSKHFIEVVDNSKIMVNINMDMISRSPKNELYVVGARYNEVLTALLEKFQNPTSTKLLQGHDGTDRKQNWTTSSDHGPFHEVKIPFLYFGNEDHSAYHKPTDDFSDITPGFYKNAVHIILNVFEAIDKTGL